MKYKVKDYPDKDGFYGKYGGRFLPPEIDEEFETILHSGPDKWIL